jgi:hypothetical protein
VGGHADGAEVVEHGLHLVGEDAMVEEPGVEGATRLRRSVGKRALPREDHPWVVVACALPDIGRR